MPTYYKKRPTRTYTKKYRKRTYRKRRYVKKHHKHGRRNPNHVRITTMRSTVPSDVLWQKFRYFEQNFHFALGTNDIFNVVDMALNNPWDPYVALGGRAANYFGKEIEMYRYARVYAAKITVQVTDNLGANTNPMNFALVLSPSTQVLSVSDPNDINSLPTNRCRRMKQFPNRIGGTRKVSMYVTMADGFYLTRSQYDNALPGEGYDITNFGSVASPTKILNAIIYYSKCATSGNLASQAVECIGNVSITYYTKLWGRIEFGEAGQ